MPDPATSLPSSVRLTAVRGDITQQAVDAVANAANSSLLGGGGVDGAIHRAGGPSILAACRELRRTQYPDGLPPGEAVTTAAGDLPATYVIHTVGPVWHGGMRGEAEALASAYRAVVREACAHEVQTLAIPSISTGAYGYPIERATPLAVQTVREALRGQAGAIAEVRFVLFSESDLEVYRRALGGSAG